MQQRFHAWLSEHAEEASLRWIFRSALAVTIALLAFDLASMTGWIVSPDPATTLAEITEDQPAPTALPAMR